MNKTVAKNVSFSLGDSKYAKLNSMSLVSLLHEILLKNTKIKMSKNSENKVQDFLNLVKIKEKQVIDDGIREKERLKKEQKRKFRFVKKWSIGQKVKFKKRYREWFVGTIIDIRLKFGEVVILVDKMVVKKDGSFELIPTKTKEVLQYNNSKIEVFDRMTIKLKIGHITID